ncbi:MAG TPA: DUF488 domain-containing protein [Oligoflexus sp.]|uniref:DUF488 domain-containing protein n=1 Tax=Oligoflexus sp. TaxID=1971216 RepID=UPI002D4EB5DA|nr:DUF488 domain-containing protein [Oligoflexus sp.]HYX33653.1 DUF488 domain-containing protein [Oligoflexus sp.]
MIYSIGHSDRTLEDLVELLQTRAITLVADVRKMPRSRTNPQFNLEMLQKDLPSVGISYVHLPRLTGLRKAGKSISSSNGWRNKSFKAYADYMESSEFSAGLDELLTIAQQSTVAVMCSEAVWWRCHRRLIADALVVRGVDVRHILSKAPAKSHQLTEIAHVEAGQLSYPEQPGVSDVQAHGVRHPVLPGKNAHAR